MCKILLYNLTNNDTFRHLIVVNVFFLLTYQDIQVVLFKTEQTKYFISLSLFLYGFQKADAKIEFILPLSFLKTAGIWAMYFKIK